MVAYIKSILIKPFQKCRQIPLIGGTTLSLNTYGDFKGEPPSSPGGLLGGNIS